MGSDITPFKGRTTVSNTPTRVLRRFAKSGHITEIRERTVSTFKAIEFIVFVDGSLLESQMFHGRRLDDYSPTLEERANQLKADGWIEQSDLSGDCD